MKRIILFVLSLFIPLFAAAAAEPTVSQEELETLKRRLAEIERKVSAGAPVRGNEFNPRLTAFGDFTGRIDNRPVVNEGGREISDRFNLRETELDFRASVDPYATGVLIVSIAQEDLPTQPTAVTAEEGYVTFTRLPKGLGLKLGKFKTAFGILNRLHAHDLPQTTLPLPIQTFLGEDGMTEMGASLNFLKPLSGEGRTLGFDVEVFNGENTVLFGGNNSRDLAYLTRGRYFTELDDESFMEIGSSLMVGKNVTNNVSSTTQLLGGDFLYKWRPAQPRGLWSMLLQSEYFYMDARDTTAQIGRRNAWGGYALAQIQPYQRWYVGLRYDVAQTLAAKYRMDRKIGTYISFYTTEFLRLRLGYEYQNSAGPVPGESPAADMSTVYGQVTFVFGSHPAEPYWVNR